MLPAPGEYIGEITPPDAIRVAHCTAPLKAAVGDFTSTPAADTSMDAADMVMLPVATSSIEPVGVMVMEAPVPFCRVTAWPAVGGRHRVPVQIGLPGLELDPDLVADVGKYQQTQRRIQDGDTRLRPGRCHPGALAADLKPTRLFRIRVVGDRCSIFTVIRSHDYLVRRSGSARVGRVHSAHNSVELSGAGDGNRTRVVSLED
jgi:hypothetical protein